MLSVRNNALRNTWNSYQRNSDLIWWDSDLWWPVEYKNLFFQAQVFYSKVNSEAFEWVMGLVQNDRVMQITVNLFNHVTIPGYKKNQSKSDRFFKSSHVRKCGHVITVVNIEQLANILWTFASARILPLKLFFKVAMTEKIRLFLFNDLWLTKREWMTFLLAWYIQKEKTDVPDLLT